MAATRGAGDIKGPKIGDAASLWNFTPAPGWSKEQAHILKLCLMKLGVGKWMQILETGLLPGKLIQQLNGQTQRLLGQQSLAAYTGLQVDIDRIRADNEARADAPRKGGLIINMGGNLTKKMKEEMQAEAKKKYGLTAAQIKEAEEELGQLATAVKETANDTAAAYAAAGSEQAGTCAAAGPALLGSDAAAMSKEEKVALLHRLHGKLVSLQAMLATHEAAAAERTRQGPPRARTASGASNQENDGQAANAEPMTVDAPAGAALKPVKGGPKRKSGGKAGGSGGRGTKRAAAKAREAEGSEDEDMAEAAAAASAADVAALAAMGFGARQARDALEETGGDVEAAAEWLMVNCA